MLIKCQKCDKEIEKNVPLTVCPYCNDYEWFGDLEWRGKIKQKNDPEESES